MSTQEYKQIAEKLHSNLKDKDEKKKAAYLIEIIKQHDNDSRQAIRAMYDNLYANTNDLIIELGKSLKNNDDFKDLIIGLFLSPVEYDCLQLKRAVSSLNKDDELIFEIFTSRPNWMIKEIEEKYPKIFKKDLKVEISACYNKKEIIKNSLITLIDTPRNENELDKNQVNKDECLNLAKKLNEAGYKWCKDPELFKTIFATKSPDELVEISREYYKNYGRIINNTVESNLFGLERKLLRELLYGLINPCELYANKLRKALKGIGLDNNTLQRIMITRHKLDMKLIKDMYEELFNESLKTEIEKETKNNENYKNLLLALLANDSQPGEV